MRVACVATDLFEDAELTDPVQALRDAGHEVDLIAPKPGEITGKHGKAKVAVDHTIQEVKADEYDALFVPGGFSPDQLRADPKFVSFTAAFDRAGKPIFGICHGAQLLLTAGVLDGRTVTAWRTIQDDLRRCGIHVVDEEVVVDGELVTSRQPSDLPAFCRVIVSMLERRAGVEREEPAPTLH